MSELDDPVFSEFVTVHTDLDERSFFIAAAMTCGFRLADNTPGLTNVYSTDETFERGQSGDVRMMLQARRILSAKL